MISAVYEFICSLVLYWEAIIRIKKKRAGLTIKILNIVVATSWAFWKGLYLLLCQQLLPAVLLY